MSVAQAGGLSESGPDLPIPRGAISRWLCRTLLTSPDRRSTTAPRSLYDRADSGDVVADDDFQLALHVVCELSYRAFAGVDDAWEWDPRVLDLRRNLERRFESALRDAVERAGLLAGVETVAAVLRRFVGPSLSEHMVRRGTADQFREFCIHRSAYQLK